MARPTTAAPAATTTSEGKTYGRMDGPTDAVRDEYDAIRAHLASSETPSTLLVIALMVMGLSVINYLLDPQFFPMAHVLDFAAAIVLLAVGMILRRADVPASGARWAFASCMVVLVLSLLIQVHVQPTTSPAYVLIVVCILGPLTLAWLPFCTAALAMIVGVAVVTAPWPGGAVTDWTFLGVTAALGSGVLMQVRLRSVQAQASAVVRANEMATTDPLTGVLNRRGLEGLLPTFTATARRLRQQVTVYFIDVDGLKAANDEHGHAFGDTVLQGVAAAVRATVREGDLVVRWGGDEFVVIGMGAESGTPEFTTRLRRSIEASDLDLARWCGTVSVGRASGDPDASTIESLVHGADEDMYDQRSSRRSTDLP